MILKSGKVITIKSANPFVSEIQDFMFRLFDQIVNVPEETKASIEEEQKSEPFSLRLCDPSSTHH